MENTLYKITCPNCGAEYLFDEIFYIDDLKTNTEIVKDKVGKIILPTSRQEVEESFTCDYCGATFDTKFEIKFVTSIVNDEFEEDIVSIKI